MAPRRIEAPDDSRGHVRGIESQPGVGTRQRALVTGKSAKHPDELAARTDNNRVVNFCGAPSLIGRYMDVTITAAAPHSLRGEVAAA